MKFFRLTCLMFALFTFASQSFARYKMGTERPVSSQRKASLKKTQKIKFSGGEHEMRRRESEVLDGLSKTYDLPVDRLRYFRDLRHGYEEIVPSLIIAREAQIEPGRVLKLRMEGESWKTIADSFSVELQPLNREVLDVLKPIRKALPSQALIERPRVMDK